MKEVGVMVRCTEQVRVLGLTMMTKFFRPMKESMKMG